MKQFLRSKILVLNGLAAIAISLTLCAFFTTDKPTMTIIPASQSEYKTIVFDIGQVLLTVPVSSQIQTIKSVIVKNPFLLYHMAKNGGASHFKGNFYKLLENIPSKTPYRIYNNNAALPYICSDWMCGMISLQELQNHAFQLTQESHYPSSIKALFAAITTIMFDAETLVSMHKEITPMVTLMKQCKQAGYKIYLCSNWDPESFPMLKASFPTIFDIADGMIISGHEKLAKPHPEFYNRLLERYAISKETTLYIDDEPYNIETAKNCFKKVILHKKPEQTYQELAQCGILKKQ
ncbi:HAD-IA family hydrolase [Candidatus Babeliales bacterium]|nr:HAD-IA family hydrolase [Candidatus Babeliales bacterium]